MSDAYERARDRERERDLRPGLEARPRGPPKRFLPPTIGQPGGGGRARTHLATADGPGDLERAGRGAKRRALSKNRRGGERSDVKVGVGVGGRGSPTGRGRPGLHALEVHRGPEDEAERVRVAPAAGRAAEERVALRRRRGARRGPRRRRATAAPRGDDDRAPGGDASPRGRTGAIAVVGNVFFWDGAGGGNRGRKSGAFREGDLLGRREATREVRGVSVRCGERGERRALLTRRRLPGGLHHATSA